MRKLSCFGGLTPHSDKADRWWGFFEVWTTIFLYRTVLPPFLGGFWSDNRGFLRHVIGKPDASWHSQCRSQHPRYKKRRSGPSSIICTKVCGIGWWLWSWTPVGYFKVGGLSPPSTVTILILMPVSRWTDFFSICQLWFFLLQGFNPGYVNTSKYGCSYGFTDRKSLAYTGYFIGFAQVKCCCSCKDKDTKHYSCELMKLSWSIPFFPFFPTCQVRLGRFLTALLLPGIPSPPDLDQKEFAEDVPDRICQYGR